MKNEVRDYNPWIESWCVPVYRRQRKGVSETVYIDTRRPIDVDFQKKVDALAQWEILPITNDPNNDDKHLMWPS